jgi:hypothetical protein
MPHSLVIDHQRSKEQATSIFRDEAEAAYWYLPTKLHNVTYHKTTLFNKLREFQVHVHSRIIFIKSLMFGKQTCADIMGVAKSCVNRSLSFCNQRGGTANIGCHFFMCVSANHVTCRTVKSGFTVMNPKSCCCLHCCYNENYCCSFCQV